MNIYIAASFAYQDKEETKNHQYVIATVADILRSTHDVFVPYEHKLPNDWDLTNHNWGMAVYGMDLAALADADVVVAISWGKRKNSDGMAWECGFACGMGKKVILLSYDPDAVESLMLASSAYAHLQTIGELRNYDFRTMPQIFTAKNEVS